MIIPSVGASLYSNLRADPAFDWLIAVLGLWIIVSSFVLGMTIMNIVMLANIVLGVINLGLGIPTAITER